MVDPQPPLPGRGRAKAERRKVWPAHLGAPRSRSQPRPDYRRWHGRAGYCGRVSESSTNQYTADDKTGVATGTVSEAETSTKSGTWAGVVATFKPMTCTGGSLSLTPPGSVGFPSVPLSGTDQSATTPVTLTPSEMTGSGTGWNVQGTSTTLTNAGGATLPIPANSRNGNYTSTWTFSIGSGP
jgi:hypothetical protein